MSDEKQLVRVNTRIGVDLNEWLDEYSARTGMSKSVIMMMAAENFRKEHQALNSMEKVGQIMDEIATIKKMLNEK